MEKLMEAKKQLEKDLDLMLETVNKKKGIKGCASFFTNGEEGIKVYEGNPDGSDDREMTYKEFLEGYTYEIVKPMI